MIRVSRQGAEENKENVKQVWRRRFDERQPDAVRLSFDDDDDESDDR